MNIIGEWMKVTVNDCGEKYPSRLTFDQNGFYRGEAAPGAADHPVWDVGTYEVNINSIRMSTSNDALIDYQAKVEENKLIFKDVEGCRVEYKRV